MLSRARAWKRALRDTIVSVSIVEGACRHGCGDVRLLCVGRVGRVPYLTDAILAPGSHARDNRRIALWKVGRFLRDQDALGCDLMLAAVPPWAWAGLMSPESYLVPDWVEGETNLATFFGTAPNRSRADDLRRLRRHGLRPKVVPRPRDLRGFYDTMHIPLIRRQHRHLAEEIPYDEMAGRFQDSELLLVERGDDPIAGVGIDTSESPPRLFGLGVREPIERHMAMGAVAAAYQFSFEHLAAAGHPRVGLGYTRPLLEDGLLRYKRKWGHRLCRHYEQATLLRVLRHAPAVDAFLMNTPFIHVTARGLQGAVFTETGNVPGSLRSTMALRFGFDGLDDVAIHPLDGTPARSLVNPTADSRAEGSVPKRRPPADGRRPDAGRDKPTTTEQIDRATTTLLEELVGYESGTPAVVCVDETTRDELLESIRVGVAARGGTCHVVVTSLDQPLPAAAHAIVDGVRRHSARILCELGDRTHYQTSAWEDSIALGARVYSLAQLDTAGFVRCVAGVDHAAMLRFGETLHAILRRGRRVVVRTAAGTELTMHTRQDRWHRILNRISRRRDAWTWKPTGMLVDGASTSFLGGQISFRPELDSLRGVAVLDGFLWPPREGGRLEESVTWKFRRGTLAAVQAPPPLGAALGLHLGGGPSYLEHFSIGFHPRATFAGGLHEAERVSGALVVGIGQGEHHTDGVMTNATIEVDGVMLLERGRFVHPFLESPRSAD